MNLIKWLLRQPKAEPIPQGPTATEMLLSRFLEIEQKRLENVVAQDQLRQELEIKRLQIEVENAEVLQKARAQDAKDREEIRQRRAEANRIARDAKAAKRIAAQGAKATSGGAAMTPESCPVCANPSNPALTTNDLSFHYSGHRGQIDLFRQ